nr:DNA repair protein RecN [Oscillospiraceae bacterium]
MLEELYIENLAVIEKACISFKHAFHVFTGETGAGKSILIHGIQAVLGQRVSKDWVRTGCERASITALFTNLPDIVINLLSEMHVACDEKQVTLTREIRADGGSIGRINGKTASVSNLKEIGLLLISIHGQHDNQVLLNSEHHLQVLDEFGGNSEFLLAYQEAFRNLQNIARELKKLKSEQQKRQQKKLILQKQIQEIGALNLKIGEEDELETALMQAENSEKIIYNLSNSANALDNDNITIQNAMQLLHEIEDVYPDIQEILPRLQACLIELKDISDDLQNQAEHISIDENKISQLR